MPVCLGRGLLPPAVLALVLLALVLSMCAPPAAHADVLIRYDGASQHYQLDGDGRFTSSESGATPYFSGNDPDDVF